MKSRLKLARVFLIVPTMLLVAFVTFPGYGACESVKDTLIIGVTETAPGIDCDVHVHPESWRIISNTQPKGIRCRYAPCGEPGVEDVLKPVFVENSCEMQPELFESWEVSEDGRTVTFHLRKWVKSAYGNEFTTKDVLWEYQRSFANKAIQMFFLMVTDIPNIDAIKIIDDYTFSMTAAHANPLIVYIMTNHCKTWHDSIEAKKHVTKDDPWAMEWIKRHASCGLGPYTVKEWVAGDRIVLKANPNYHLGEPAIKTIIYKVIPESSSRMAMLRDGTIDVAHGLSPSELDSLKAAPGVRVIQLSNIIACWGLMNNNIKPFDNKLVRQAINYATPREGICKTAYLGYAHPWNACIPSVYPAATGPEDFPYSYDLNKAKELLIKAGYPDGFKVELAYGSGNIPFETAATLIKTSLAKIGIDVSLRKMPPGTLTTKVQSKEMPFALWTDMPMMADPNYCLTLTYYSKSFINYINYRNTEVDRLIEEGIGILEPKQRLKHHTAIQKMIMEDAPIIFAWEPDYTVAIRDNIKGWNWNTMQDTLFELVSFIK